MTALLQQPLTSHRFAEYGWADDRLRGRPRSEAAPVTETAILLAGFGLIGCAAVVKASRGVPTLIAGVGLVALGVYRLVQPSAESPEPAAGDTISAVSSDAGSDQAADESDVVIVGSFAEDGSAVIACEVTSVGSDSLTAEEHAAALIRAYFHALERGGGFLPAFDHWAAHDDFCRAAGHVLSLRMRT